MSTVPVDVPPGFRFEAVRIAWFAFELLCESVPELNVLDGLAVAELKFAPDPTAMPAAARTTSRASEHLSRRRRPQCLETRHTSSFWGTPPNCARQSVGIAPGNLRRMSAHRKQSSYIRPDRLDSAANRPEDVGVMPSRMSLRPGFLLSFALLLAIGVGGLAYAVSSVSSSDIRDEQVSAARERAELLAQAAFAPPLRAKLSGLDAADLRPLDAGGARRQAVGGADVAGRLGSPRPHRLRDRPRRRSTAPTCGRPRSPRRSPARPSSRPRTSRPARSTRRRADRSRSSSRCSVQDAEKPHAVFELHAPYAPVAAEISRRTQRINLILLGGALLFLAGMWPRLIAASRALREREDPRRKAILRELKSAIEHQRARAALPAEGRTCGRARSPRSSRSCAGTIPSDGRAEPAEIPAVRGRQRPDRSAHRAPDRAGPARLRRLALARRQRRRRRQPRRRAACSTRSCRRRSSGCSPSGSCPRARSASS